MHRTNASGQLCWNDFLETSVKETFLLELVLPSYDPVEETCECGLAPKLERTFQPDSPEKRDLEFFSCKGWTLCRPASDSLL